MGGAIYNNGNIQKLSGIFISNSSSEAGGAIYNSAGKTINVIENSTFTGNYTTSAEAEKGNGGAIYNAGQINTITGSLFNYNGINDYSRTDSIATQNGGAIYNAGAEINIIDTNFIGNKATQNGGAIYNNGGILNISADEKNVEFSANKVLDKENNEVSNAIYNNNGTINFFADNNKQILINDGITGKEGTDATININQTVNGVDKEYTGTVLFNGDVLNHTVNMYNGKLSLGEDGKTIDVGILNMHGGILDIQNGKIEDIDINCVGEKGIKLEFDVDLENLTSDYLKGEFTVNSIIELETINILKDAAADWSGGNIIISDKNINTSDNLSKELGAFTSNYKYTFEKDTNTNYIKVTKSTDTNSGGFINAVQSTTTAKSYSMTKNEVLTSNVGTMRGTKLTVYGNSQGLNANGNAGFTMSDSQTFVINDVGQFDITNDEITSSVTGFNNSTDDGGFVSNNGGTITIKNTAFSGNISAGNGGVINNTGKVESDNSIFKDNNAKLGGAIYNSGTLNLTDTSFIDNEATEKGGAIYNDGGEINIIASDYDVKFKGNKDSSEGNNAIYNNNGTVNINAAEFRNVTFYDKIEGQDSSIININKDNSALNAPVDGTVLLRMM